MSSFKNDILKTHNSYRKVHSAPALKWSNKLYQNAQRWADQLAKRGYMQHENQNEEGENIACMKGSFIVNLAMFFFFYYFLQKGLNMHHLKHLMLAFIMHHHGYSTLE